MLEVKTILNARSFSEPSAAAHQLACDVARRYEAKLILLHVTDKPVYSYFEQASELPPDELQRKPFASLQLPAESEQGLNVEHRITEGDAVQQILRVAHDENCELIVLGMQGSGPNGGFSLVYDERCGGCRTASCLFRVDFESFPDTTTPRPRSRRKARSWQRNEQHEQHVIRADSPSELTTEISWTSHVLG